MDSARELSEKGVDVPVEGVDVPVADGVIVTALSWDANFPFCHGWSFQELLGARLSVGVGDKVVDNAGNTFDTHACFWR